MFRMVIETHVSGAYKFCCFGSIKSILSLALRNKFLVNLSIKEMIDFENIIRRWNKKMTMILAN